MKREFPGWLLNRAHPLARDFQSRSPLFRCFNCFSSDFRSSKSCHAQGTHRAIGRKSHERDRSKDSFINGIPRKKLCDYVYETASVVDQRRF